MEDRLPRKLAAILHADVAGYSRLSGEDEDTTHRRLKEYLDLISDSVSIYHGRVINYAGDAVLATFEAVVDAISCAAAIQQNLSTHNHELPEDQKVLFRIGVNLGDVIEDGGSVYGDGVNVAARLEGLADPGGICISDSVFTAVGGKLPLDYEDIGGQLVKNIVDPVHAYKVYLQPGMAIPEPSSQIKSRRWQWAVAVILTGITLCAVLLAWFKPWEQREEPASAQSMAFPLPDKPSIAVLPFVNMSNDEEQEYFVDGMTEDLITDLSKLSGLFVIARNSVFTYKGRAVKVNEVAEELGVRYVLEGSVQRAGEEIRVNVQLIDAIAGGHLWAERYDRQLGHVFKLQDELSSKILSALEVKLTSKESDLKTKKYIKQLDAYESFQKGLALGGPRSKEAILEARAFFEEAIQLDPTFARAYSALANTHRIEYRNGWSEMPEESMAKAFTLANHAMVLGDSIPQVHFVMAVIHREAQNHAESVLHAQRAIELDPNYADAYVALASTLCYGGRADEGLELMQRSIRLNPFHPSNYPFHLGQCLYALARYDEAIEAFGLAIDMAPDSQRLHVWLAASYVLTGNIDEAEWEAENILVINPDFSVESLRVAVPFKDSGTLEFFLAALRKAGLPQ